MDWPTAAVLIAAIAAVLAAYIVSAWTSTTDGGAEAIGFHHDFITQDDDDE